MCSIQFPAINQADARDRSESLKALLKHFNENRHHVTNPQGKQRVRQFILTTFLDLGLKAWFEGFKPDYPQVKTKQLKKITSWIKPFHWNATSIRSFFDI